MRRRAVLAGAALPAMPAAAHDYRAGDLFIDHPWTRAAGANANGAGYLIIQNRGTAPERLLSASTAGARRVELHSMIREGEVMRMRPVADLPIPPGERVYLRPGGLHLMLVGLTAPLEAGGTLPLTLVFERAGAVEVTLEVARAGAAAGPAHGH